MNRGTKRIIYRMKGRADSDLIVTLDDRQSIDDEFNKVICDYNNMSNHQLLIIMDKVAVPKENILFIEKHIITRG